MRRAALALIPASVLAVGGAAAAVPLRPSHPIVPPVPGTSVMSRNVGHLGTIPIDGVAVSMRTVTVDGQVRAVVSGMGGLSVYDATDPRHPLLLSHLPLPNYENEDIAVAQDGSVALVTEMTGNVYLHVIDISDPTLPVPAGTLLLNAGHTAECADPHCSYAFGNYGDTFDLRDRAHPVQVPDAQSWGVLTGAGDQGHALHQDAAGYWISDTNPLVMFKQDPDPFHLTVYTSGAITKNTAYQHNNNRPRADRWVPRPAAAGTGAPYRNGELLLGEGETSFVPVCTGDTGAFSTWSVVNFDRGQPMQQLDVLRPLNGVVGSADPAMDLAACSGHWFTQRDGQDGSILVAAAWYEHGTRFLSVNPRTGAISVIGWFQPQRGTAAASYWMNDTTVWTVDYRSGIDILTFDESPALRPSAAAINASWSSVTHADPFAEAMRRVCRAGSEATAADHARVHALLG